MSSRRSRVNRIPRTIDVAYRYYGGAGTQYVASRITVISDAAAHDPQTALFLLDLFLRTIPPKIAAQAYEAMSRVTLPDSFISQVEAMVSDGIIDDYTAKQIMDDALAREKIKTAFLAISEWLHDALFVKSQYLREVPVTDGEV